MTATIEALSQAKHIDGKWPALSITGRSLPSSRVSERDELIAMKAFFDGSGSRNSEFIVLSGVAADDRAWNGFDVGWMDVLGRQQLKPKYLHMHELCALKGEYSADKGWTEELAGKVVVDCLMYAQQLDKEAFRLFTCHIDMDEYRDLEAKGILLPDCYDLCARFSPERILHWYVERFSDVFPQSLHYYFDQNERFKGKFEKRWIKGKKSGRGLSTHWHLIKTVTTVEMRDTPEVQLADLCAWAYHRRLVNLKHGTKGKYWHLASLAEKVLPNDRKPIDAEGLSLLAFYSEKYPHMLRELGLQG